MMQKVAVKNLKKAIVTLVFQILKKFNKIIKMIYLIVKLTDFLILVSLMYGSSIQQHESCGTYDMINNNNTIISD